MLTKTVLMLIPIAALLSTGAFGQTINYSGSDCVKRSGGDINYDYDGGVGNTNTTSLSWVVCHVPHADFDGFGHNGGIENGWFDAHDGHTSRNIACRFRGHSINTSANRIDRQYGSMGYTGDLGYQRVNLGGVGENQYSSYVLACSMPDSDAGRVSRVYTYRVNQ